MKISYQLINLFFFIRFILSRLKVLNSFREGNYSRFLTCDVSLCMPLMTGPKGRKYMRNTHLFSYIYGNIKALRIGAPPWIIFSSPSLL